MSEPTAGLPAWLELRWERAITPAYIQLIFDTGLHRVLTLSHSDAYVSRMQWGQAQSECVRDYRLEGEVDGTWQTLVEITDNYQRRAHHTLDNPPSIRALRVHISATNGLDHARICEVRVYEGNGGA